MQSNNKLYARKPMNASLDWGCFWLARTPSSSQSALSVEWVKEACAVSSLISISQWHGSERSCSVPAWTLSALYGPVWWSGPDPLRTGHLWTDAALALASGGAVTPPAWVWWSYHTVKLPFHQINSFLQKHDDSVSLQMIWCRAHILFTGFSEAVTVWWISIV